MLDSAGMTSDGGRFLGFWTGKTKGVKGIFSAVSILFDEMSATFCSLAKSMSRLKRGDNLTGGGSALLISL